MRTKIANSETRALQQIRDQYKIEKELAEVLRNASKDERKGLYTVIYDQLYRRVPHHSQLTRKVDLQSRAKHVISQLRFLRRYLSPEITFLEIGPGDCSLAFEVARFVKRVYAVDISEEITSNPNRPENVEIIISDGCTIPIPQGSVNVAYSNQLMEHLHPDDALDQLRNIYNSLTESGVYVCITPSRLNGPHDISKYFDQIATGLHLKEYTITELAIMFKRAGFTRAQKGISVRGLVFLLPIFPFIGIEALFSKLPTALSKKISRWKLFHLLMYVKLIATK